MLDKNEFGKKCVIKIIIVSIKVEYPSLFIVCSIFNLTDYSREYHFVARCFV